jgi:prepilin-type N-terminal cleavage/methylation domain-containing protein
MTCLLRSTPRSCAASCSSRRAFTLIEVLATMVMLGIVLPVAMRGVSIALATASSARHRAEAAELGSAKLDELVATGEWSATAPSGDFGTDFPGYTWTVEMASRDYGVTEIQLTVTWQERGQPRTLNLATLVSDVNTAGQQVGMIPWRGHLTLAPAASAAPTERLAPRTRGRDALATIWSSRSVSSSPSQQPRRPPSPSRTTCSTSTRLSTARSSHSSSSSTSRCGRSST